MRPATPADVPRLAALERACFPDPWSAESLGELLAAPGAVGWVVQERGGIVAYALARWVAETAELLNLAVAPAHRRRGIARALLDRVLEDLRAQGVGEVYLEVRESNAPARRLYETRGFRVAGMRRAYYRHPTEDALLLRLTVTGSA
jgi:ribosomal-protein-alanine N-acetyltransferase